jgi:uncharacterized protein (TIGR03435 family)
METRPPAKPPHKDLSFWIVVVTLVGAADGAQLYYGVPWLHQKILDSRPAPTQVLDRSEILDAFNQPVDLDRTAKTYVWQKPRYASQILEATPPQVVLTPTEFTGPTGGWAADRSNAVIGIRMPAAYVLQKAYGWSSRVRMLLPEDMPNGQFDFIANLPQGSLEALQAEIRKKWGLIAVRESRQTNALVLKLHHTGAPRLKAPPPGASPSGGMTAIVPFSFVPNWLEQVLQTPVIDETGLSGRYEIQFGGVSVVRRGEGLSDETRKFFLEQYGLELEETNTTVEMLVVKKAPGHE